jgi:hypothetical protein
LNAKDVKGAKGWEVRSERNSSDSVFEELGVEVAQ